LYGGAPGTSGARLFPNLTPTGGEIYGVPALVTDALGATSSLLVDATALLGNSDLLTLDALRHGIVQMDTAPDSPPVASTVPISLWQNDDVALVAERYWGFVIGRAGAVATMSGLS